ncbi:MAG: invasion associated locus B family protein [Pseudomonadota bacterium]|nr:invasion associated locus B family protein [Pseudomonadota bacterium]
MRFLIAALVAGILSSVSPVLATQIGTFKDWSAYAEGKGKSRTCWIYSEPIKNEGKYKKRGRIYSMVSHAQGGKVINQVQFTAGYTFKNGSTVRVMIGRQTFELFTDADTAWAQNPKDDVMMVRAMRSGAKMIVNGVSSRGTQTKDTYSLSGISAAHKAIGRACRIK